MALRTILLAVVALLCLNLASSLVVISNITSSDLVIKGLYSSCTNASYEFECGDPAQSCIFSSFVCDSIIDCPNGADETHGMCAAQWKEQCAQDKKFPNLKPFKFTNCTNGMCISECDVCDGHYLDCIDGSDEDPTLCSNPPEIQGDCTSYRESYPIPTNEETETTLIPTTLLPETST